MGMWFLRFSGNGEYLPASEALAAPYAACSQAHLPGVTSHCARGPSG